MKYKIVTKVEQANPFASTFYFYLRTMQPHEKIKLNCKLFSGRVIYSTQNQR